MAELHIHSSVLVYVDQFVSVRQLLSVLPHVHFHHLLPAIRVRILLRRFGRTLAFRFRALVSVVLERDMFINVKFLAKFYF